MKLSEVALNVGNIESGQWIENIPEMDNLRIKTRGINNADWRRKMSKLLATVPRDKRRGNNVDGDEMDKIISQCLYECALQDWGNLSDADGKDIAYSKDFALTLLTDPQYRRFRDAALFAASIVGDEVAVSEEVVKN